MDPKYLIVILFCGHLNNTSSSETEVFTTEKQQQSTSFNPSISYVSANSQTITRKPSGQPKQFNNSGQATPPTKIIGQPTTAAYSGKLAVHTSSRQQLNYNITSEPILTANTSSQQSALPVFTSASQLPPSAYTSTRQSPPFVNTSPQQPSLSLHTSSKKPIPRTIHNLPTEATPAVQSSPRNTPGFIRETTTKKIPPPKTKSNSLAAILIGVILTFMLIAIIMIVLWKCLRKPALNDQNWAGRSPFADGTTPDMCLDNLRENEATPKRTSIISLMGWKPSKSTLLADDLEIKLFESSENIEESNNPSREKIKDQVNGTSEDSAGGSTIGTAISSSDDADTVLPPPPLLDLEEQENNQSDKPTMTITAPLSNDSTNLPASQDCLTQVSEDQVSELNQSFPLPPDSLNLPLPPEDFMENQKESNNEILCQEFSIPSESDEDLNESLPPPPTELL